MEMPSTFSTPRWLVRFSQPAVSKPSLRSSQGLWTTPTAGALPFRPCLPLAFSSKYRAGLRSLGP